MNILFVCKYDIDQGGVANVLKSLTAYLSNQKHQITILTHRKGQYNLLSEKTKDHTRLYIDFGVAKFFQQFIYRNRLKKIIRDHAIELIHAHGLSRATLAYQLSRWTNTPLMVTSHGDLNHKKIKRFKTRYTIKKYLKHAKAVTHLTEPMAEKAHAIYNTAFKSHIIHNGIDEASSNTDESLDKKPYLIAIGRFVKQKGFATLITNYHAAVLRGLPYGLVILGDGPEKRALIDLAHSYGISVEYKVSQTPKANTLYLPGYLDNAIKYQTLKQARCLLFPSETDEALSLVLLEGMTCGLAIIANNFPMTRYLQKQGMQAMLIEEKRESDWVKALLSLETLTLDPIANQNKQCATLFQADLVNAQYEKLYHSILDESIYSRPLF